MTRGLKSTPYQDPRVTVGRPTIVILPEWKEAPAEGAGGPREKGLRLFTVRDRVAAGAAAGVGVFTWPRHCVRGCVRSCVCLSVST